MIATYITALLIQDIWHDCIEPQERHIAFDKYLSNYEMCTNRWFLKIHSYIMVLKNEMILKAYIAV